MTRYTKDPELNELAKELKDLVWIDPLTEAELDEVHRLTTDPAARRRLVIPMPDFRHYSIRMYMGGETRTLGLVHSDNVGAAFRFADMIQEYFWKYRVRGANPPAERDLNFDYDRLHADMANEVNALDLLKRMEEYLLRSGAIKSSATRRQEIAAKRDARLTRWDETKLEFSELRELLAAVSDTQQSLIKQLDYLRGQVQVLIDRPAMPLFMPQPFSPQPLTPSPFLPSPLWGPTSTGDPLPRTPITVCGNQIAGQSGVTQQTNT